MSNTTSTVQGDEPPADLSVQIGSLKLRNPLIGASGTVNFGLELEAFFDPRCWGGLVGKSITRLPRRGNPPPRTAETPSGMLNSIGLENKGFDAFRETILPRFRTLPTVRIVSIAGETVEEYAELAGLLDPLDGFDGIEVNLSCPNVKKGGLEFARDPAAIERITRVVRDAFKRPLWVKLSPNVSDLGILAKGAADGGADALVAVNTFVGMAVDWRRRRPKIGSVTGGLSGPAIKPLALRAVWELSRRVSLPIVASGGAVSADDVLEFLTVGARAVQIGTANFMNPRAGYEIGEELGRLLKERGMTRIEEQIGTLVS
jgi:dihydroorotate dehydrogenase (NAD+) catalytic subunit